MPVRLLSSSVLKWPRREEVLAAARAWAVALVDSRPDVESVYCFGSCAQATGWGVGSDVDLAIIVVDSPVPFVRRAAEFDAGGLPVPADVLAYTRAEWSAGCCAAVGLIRTIDAHGLLLASR